LRVFIDTSSLFKKYVEEKGSGKLQKILINVTEIVISPITLLEVNSILERRLREKTLKNEDAAWILKEFKTDFNYFGVAEWNNNLEKESIKLIRKYQLKVLDGIQLASGIISSSKIFITSDKKLYKFAIKELEETVLI